ncbi:MAG: PEP-CTERM sorting domain-containing protein [Planctomycetia bacterium]|nr:PEP-CTERM sorting domain-containing protein [Planctomycetia bacterium]
MDNSLLASSRLIDLPSVGANFLGFRVATVPEPATLLLAVCGAIGLLLTSVRRP